jgi:hypothetical protein
MISRNVAALLFGAALVIGPAASLVAVAPAHAQSGPTTIQIQSAIATAVRNARSAPGFAGLTPAQRALQLAAAVQAAVAQELTGGASANDVSSALANLVNAGTISLSVAAQGAAQAATQVAGATGASGDAKGQALALVTGLSNGTGPLGVQVAQAGGLQAATGSTNGGGNHNGQGNNGQGGNGQGGNGQGNNGQGNNNGQGYHPCTNVVADYC